MLICELWRNRWVDSVEAEVQMFVIPESVKHRKKTAVEKFWIEFG